MAKEFKVYDQKYKKLTGGALKWMFSKTGWPQGTEIADIEGWDLFQTDAYNASQIRWAVYDSPDAEEWQKFRVGMKGLSTKEKLYALKWWLTNATNLLYTSYDRDLIRVHNYLGALKRSGHLDASLKIVKQ